VDRLPNMTFCGPARDTVLTNRQTEKLNFDTNYITILYVLRLYDILINRQRQLVEISHCTYSLRSWFFQRIIKIACAQMKPKTANIYT
jgi:hypothetical protein